MQRVNCPNRRNWRSVTLSCGSERNNENEENGANSRSFLSPSHNYAILKHQMEMAAKSEVRVHVFVFLLFEKKKFSCQNKNKKKKEKCLVFIFNYD